ncbi:hemicentin-1-like [Pseudophryne corroboree]|uniref:hemicentin-1-like n=1 Tax=Pseudophryne corroboree TaxID=495146 RepID=UPI00308210F0
MKDDLRQLKLVNGWLLDQVSAKFPCGIRQYTMVEYNDPRIGPVQSTDSSTIFDGFFNNITVHGGGDCPEMVIKGLEVALESSPPNSVILVLTDASAKDYNDKNLTDRVDMLIATKQSKIFFLITGQCSGIMDIKYLIYRDIASASFGHVFRVRLSELNKVFYYLDFILSRPVNSSARLFSADYDDGDNNDSFSVADNFTALIVTTDGITQSVQVARPNGLEIELKVIVSENWGSVYIVKNPVLGTWTIHVRGEGLHSIRVEGFKAKNTSFTAYCSDCHPNATCEEYFGNKECSCDEGFIGDGFTCCDIDECAFYWSNNCSDICVNTLGSYTCECRSGYTRSVKDVCVDIDECYDADLNECHPLAMCSNSAGSYSCSCKAGHYGDGFQCHPEACTTDICDQGMECLKQVESVNCSDPCINYITINEPWRSTFNMFGSHCDRNKIGWYRFTGRGGIRIPEGCVPKEKCSTGAPMWINGSHPSPDEGIITLTACATWNENCCHWRTTVKVKACPLGYHVYKLNGIPKCPLAFCTDPASWTEPCSCAEDEECKVVNGAKGCYCKDGLEVLVWSELTRYCNNIAENYSTELHLELKMRAADLERMIPIPSKEKEQYIQIETALLTLEKYFYMYIT